MNLRPASRDQSGMAVLIVIVLLVVMFALVMAATHSLTHLKSELKEIEHDQTNRLATAVKLRNP
jgi:Tfp pilus assembly protein PilX